MTTVLAWLTSIGMAIALAFLTRAVSNAFRELERAEAQLHRLRLQRDALEFQNEELCRRLAAGDARVEQSLREGKL